MPAMTPLEALFQAYEDARRNKRNTLNALAFELNYETKLFSLYEEVMSGRYQIGSSVCFISFNPVKREVFAANFRDRIIHHFIYNYLSPIFERLFINDDYSCRVDKGTSYGIKRADHFIRSCSENYIKDCYILKLDIKGYFMSIDRTLLFEKVKSSVLRFRSEIDVDTDLLLGLIRQVVYNDPTKNCLVRGKRTGWVGLPKSKSLFFAGRDKGLPIGNLTSQLFGNVYLNDFDYFIKCKLGCRYYGRYVDDIIIVHRDKEFLKSVIPVINGYLRDILNLRLHPKKIYLQPYSKGVSFLGAIIKPHRIYTGNKTKGEFFRCVQKWNQCLFNHAGVMSQEEVQKFVASVNSYLGAMKHYRTYKLRKRMLTEVLLKDWVKYIEIDPKYDKVIKK